MLMIDAEKARQRLATKDELEQLADRISAQFEKKLRVWALAVISLNLAGVWGLLNLYL